MDVRPSKALRSLAAIVVLLALPAGVSAQEATMSGTVSDSTGGVLPGVTITVAHEASGNTFVVVTDDRGAFRLPVRIGAYRVTAELQGFATVTRAANLLVGQTGVVTIQMLPSSVQESIIVTGEAPLVDAATSTLGGNIDRRQMQELPINGRNWMDLSMLAPGSRQNEQSNIPQSRQGYAQINIDGQQITHLIPGTGSEPAELRHGRDRGVRARDEPVRRDAGAVGRHDGERGHEVGDEHLLGHAYPGSSAAIASTRRTSSRTACSRTRTSR